MKIFQVAIVINVAFILFAGGGMILFPKDKTADEMLLETLPIPAETWIRVADQKPRDNEVVLCLDSTQNYIRPCIVSGLTPEIKFWMPMPEMPLEIQLEGTAQPLKRNRCGNDFLHRSY